MTTPNAALMRRYGTEEVFQQKTAGAASLVERLAGGLLSYGRAKMNESDDNKTRAQAEAMNEMIRERELMKVDLAGQLLRGTPVPRLPRPSAPMRDVPTGTIDDGQWQHDYDDGMVALASVAARTGAELAKEAGLGNFAAFAQSLGTAAKGLGGAGNAGSLVSKGKNFLTGGMGLKTNLGLAAAGAGALYLGNKGLQAATHAMGHEASGPATYGGGRFGFQLPYGVNAYGQPQVGTPL